MTNTCDICGEEADELFGPFMLPDDFDSDTEVLVCFDCAGAEDLR